MISTVNVNTNLFQREGVKNNVCYRFSRQMYNWKLPHVNLPLSVRWGAIWQHTIVREAMDRTLCSKESSRSAVFAKKQLFENKRKRTLEKVFPFSPMILFDHDEEEERWKKLIDTQNFSNIGCGTLLKEGLDTEKTDDAWSKN